MNSRENSRTIVAAAVVGLLGENWSGIMGQGEL
jgi:hypothetical protein